MRKLKYLVILLIAWIYIQSTIEPYPSIPVSHPNEKVSWGIGKVKEENGQPRDCVEANHTYTEYGATFVGSSEPIIYLTLLILSTSFLIDESFNPFLYFRF